MDICFTVELLSEYSNVIYLLKKNDIRTAQMKEMELEIKKLILNTVVKKLKMKISKPVDNTPPRRYFGNLFLSC